MAKIARNIKNSLFMVAVDYLFREKLVKSQKAFCERIGITESTLSHIKGNTTTVSDSTIRKMNEEFDNCFNMAYFRGESTYYLMSDLIEAHKPAPKADPQPIDHSSLVNAMLAAKDETIAAKDRLIASLEEQLKMAKELLATYQHHTTPYSITPSEMLKAAEDKDKDK
jgi:transcriptional regulator with XRE-family HTH domain